MAADNPQLLLVDDDVQCLSVRRMLFEAFKFRVVTCTNPKQALRLYKLQHFDAAVIDFQMPEMNGGELAKAMKETHPGTPVVILSGLPYLPEDTPVFYDRFYCKTEPGFKIVKEVQGLVENSDHNDGNGHPVGWSARVMAAAGIVVGMATEAGKKVLPSTKPLTASNLTAS
ncbi:MAG TPA: response regulator [Terriglobales bacterium]|nr:response regulator [Terriglobales bacterium]